MQVWQYYGIDEAVNNQHDASRNEEDGNSGQLEVFPEYLHLLMERDGIFIKSRG